MYVKWQVKKRSSAWHSRGDLLTATLVECRRVEGKPRQQVVAYLGSVRLDYAGQHKIHHVYFWDAVSERLDRLGDRLDIKTRQKIEAKLAQRVAKPSARERAKLLDNLWRSRAV